MNKLRILVLTPEIYRLGGVSNHYLGLKPHWKQKVKYHFYGKRKNIPALLMFPFDIFGFIYKLIFFNPHCVIINPSFRKYQIFRDSLYLLLAKFFNKKVITYFHGWDSALSEKVQKFPLLFMWIFNKSLFIYVLYSEFKVQLQKIGITVPILLTTTKVDDTYLETIDIKARNGSIKNILFLARIESYKGIYEAIETFKLLSTSEKELCLTVVGDGSELRKVKEFVYNSKMNNVKFKGTLKGKKLIQEFIGADVYLFPSHAEGMPTSVLEAMAFGLPIISSSVGGLNDFFQNDKMGYLVKSFEPSDYAHTIEMLIQDPSKTKSISQFNHEFAVNNFLASTVANKIERDIKYYNLH